MPHFLELLTSKKKRLKFDGMTAILTLTSEKGQDIYEQLPVILAAAEKGSVITKDGAFKILVQLAEEAALKQDMLPLLLEQLKISPSNQFPMYAELVQPVLEGPTKAACIELLKTRVNEMEKESKRKRIQKILKKLEV